MECTRNILNFAVLWFGTLADTKPCENKQKSPKSLNLVPAKFNTVKVD